MAVQEPDHLIDRLVTRAPVRNLRIGRENMAVVRSGGAPYPVHSIAPGCNGYVPAADLFAAPLEVASHGSPFVRLAVNWTGRAPQPCEEGMNITARPFLAGGRTPREEAGSLRFGNRGWLGQDHYTSDRRSPL